MLRTLVWLAPIGLIGIFLTSSTVGSRFVKAQAQDDVLNNRVVATAADVATPVEAVAIVERAVVERAVDPFVGEPARATATGRPSLPRPNISRPAKTALTRAETQGDQFEMQCEQLRAQIHAAKASGNSARIAELRSNLTQAAKEHFEWLESQRKEQIESLAARLETLKSVLEARSLNAEQIVERRVKQLLGESDSLDWNPQIETNETWRSPDVRSSDSRSRPVPTRPDVSNSDRYSILMNSAFAKSPAKAVEKLRSEQKRLDINASQLDKLQSELNVFVAPENARLETTRPAILEERRTIIEEQLRKLEAEKRALMKSKSKTPDTFQ